MTLQAVLICFLAQPAISAERLKFERLDEDLQRMAQVNHMPGLAIGIVRHGQLVHARGFGRTRFTGGAPITARTLFHAASITKTLVAAAVMQLKERGSVDLNNRVDRYLPYFHLADPRAADITVLQLLTHTSGMPDVADYRWDRPEFDAGSLERYVRSLGNERLIATPGDRYFYSNMAFEVLGDLVAKVSGTSFEDYVRKNLLIPAGMSSSTLFFPSHRGDRTLAATVATGYVKDTSGRPVPAADYPYNRMHTPSSDLATNIVDLARWAMVNLDGGRTAGGRILTTADQEDMWRPHANIGSGAEVGITWFLSSYRGLRTVGHSGSDAGFHSNLVIIPARSTAVIYLANCNYDPREEFTDVLLDAALQRE
jgi:CubicO group peptidase (beta-lactamase class C family)